MRNDRINYVIVGGFTLAILVGVVVSVGLLTGRTGATDTYYTSYRDATGLKFGSRVLYMGYPVGQVVSITPTFDSGTPGFRVELALSRKLRDWRIPADSEARIKAAGLLAAINIDIRAGKSSQVLAPGDSIRGVERRDMLGAMADTANTVKRLTENTIKPMFENLNRSVSLFGDVLDRDAGPLLSNLNQVARLLAERGPGALDGFVRATGAITEVSTSLGTVLNKDNAAKAGGVIDDVATAARNLMALSETARWQLAVLLGSRTSSRVDATLDDLRAASAEARALATRANQQLDTVLNDETTGRARATLENLHGASAELSTAAKRARTGIEEILAPAHLRGVDRTLANIEVASHDLRAGIGDTRRGVGNLLGKRTAERARRVMKNLSEAAANVARLSRNVDRRLGEVLTPQTAARARAALVSFASAADNVARLTADLTGTRARLDKLLGSLDAVIGENRPDIRRAVRDTRYTLATLREHVDAITYNLEDSSRQMLEFSRRLRQDPSLLLRGGAPPDEAASVATGGAVN